MSVAFSVVIPLYNKEDYILETLESVFNQSHTEFEIIVVNDGSTDKSLEIVKELNNSKIRIVEHEKNLGLSAARNSGIAAAKNDYIAFLDADDCWHTIFLERIAYLVKEFPSEKVYATYFQENFNGKTLFPKTKIPKNKKGSAFVVDNFFGTNTGRIIFTQSCLAMHKSVLERINSYASSITFAEDIDFFIRCFSKYDLAYYYETCHTQNTTVSKSLTQSSTSDKKYPDLKKYLGISKDIDHFIYFNIYSFCQRLKLEGRSNESIKLRKDVDLKQLSKLQVLMLYLPLTLYKPIAIIKKILLTKGIQPNTY